MLHSSNNLDTDNTMGPKRERAAVFRMDVAAFTVPREEAITWINQVLETTYEDVEDIAMRGAEWCQLIHFCTTPEEGILDLTQVHFDEKLTTAQVDSNYAVLTQAFTNLGLDCEYLSSAENLGHLKQGWYSQSIDLLHFVKYFVTFMGSPLFYHPKHERDEVTARRQAQREAQERLEKKEQQAAQKNASRPASQRRIPLAQRSQPQRRPLAVVNKNAPMSSAALKRRPAGSAASAGPSGEAALKGKLVEMEAKMGHNDELLNTLALNFDTAIKRVSDYMAATPDMPQHAKEHVLGLLTESMKE